MGCAAAIPTKGLVGLPEESLRDRGGLTAVGERRMLIAALPSGQFRRKTNTRVEWVPTAALRGDDCRGRNFVRELGRADAQFDEWIVDGTDPVWARGD